MSRTNPNKFDLPAWFSIGGAERYSGLGRSLIYEHINGGTLVSSTVKLPGRSRGRRLVQRASLDRLIESGVGKKSADNTGRSSSKMAVLPDKPSTNPSATTHSDNENTTA